MSGDLYTIELRNKEFELRILKECVEDYFDMPINSMLWKDFYRFYKERMEGKSYRGEEKMDKEEINDLLDKEEETEVDPTTMEDEEVEMPPDELDLDPPQDSEEDLPPLDQMEQTESLSDSKCFHCKHFFAMRWTNGVVHFEENRCLKSRIELKGEVTDCNCFELKCKKC